MKNCCFSLMAILLLFYPLHGMERLEKLFVSLSTKHNSESENKTSGPKVTTKTSTNTQTGEKTYTTNYPITQNGLVRLNDYVQFNSILYPGTLYPEDCKKINVKVIKDDVDQVIVSATLDKRVWEFLDKAEPNRKLWHEIDHIDEWDLKHLWIPWWDDSILDMENYMQAERDDKLRGSNRLLIQIREPGNYCITIPKDAEVEDSLTNGTVEYQFEKPIFAPAEERCWKNEKLVKINDNPINKKRIYETVYELNGQKGLIRIKAAQALLYLYRHAANSVKVIAELDKKISDSKKNQDNELVWTPWSDDVNKQNNKLTNRLLLDLNESGKYTITVPNDADIETAIEEGNITYASSRPSKVHVEATDVNSWGDNGSSTDKGERWDYYWGNEADPKIDLRTKKGKISVFHSDSK